MVKKMMFLFVLMALMICMSCNAGEIHKVGGSSGWTSINLAPNYYKSWTTSKVFHVGDTILFEYNKEFHNVVRVTHKNFNACNSTRPYSKWATGNDSFPIRRAGHYYFICGTPGHCEAGQKVDIRVLPEQPKHSPGPVHAPSPSTPGPVHAPSPSTPAPVHAPSQSTPPPVPAPSQSTPPPVPAPRQSTPPPVYAPRQSTPAPVNAPIPSTPAPVHAPSQSTPPPVNAPSPSTPGASPPSVSPSPPSPPSEASSPPSEAASPPKTSASPAEPPKKSAAYSINSYAKPWFAVAVFVATIAF